MSCCFVYPNVMNDMGEFLVRAVLKVETEQILAYFWCDETLQRLTTALVQEGIVFSLEERPDTVYNDLIAYPLVGSSFETTVFQQSFGAGQNRNLGMSTIRAHPIRRE